MTLYEDIAHRLGDLINKEVYPVNSRLPGVRRLAQQFEVSISTIVQTLQHLEIPCDPRTGMSIKALQLALEQWPVKCCVVIPNYSNPLGCLMPLDRKHQLLDLIKQSGIALIENAIYADLDHKGAYPSALHGLAQQREMDQVFYCSSFSKTIAPGLRTGWLIPTQSSYQHIEYLKYVNNLAVPTLSQLAIIDFLETGGYERYLRKIQNQYNQQVDYFTRTVSNYFPAETRVSHPAGGFVLWLELPQSIKTLKITQIALQEKISMAPGDIFSPSQKFQNCMRLNCAQPKSERLESALQWLGKIFNKALYR